MEQMKDFFETLVKIDDNSLAVFIAMLYAVRNSDEPYNPEMIVDIDAIASEIGVTPDEAEEAIYKLIDEGLFGKL